VSTDTDRLIVDELRAAPGDLIAVYRFGSTAHGTTHPGSDTDVAVLMRQRLSPESAPVVLEPLPSRRRGSRGYASGLVTAAADV
jgi:predicted nucleotidyltransferase